MEIAQKLYAESVLVGSQWLAEQTIALDERGYIVSVNAGKDADAQDVNGALIPGMINCHSHAFQRAFAGFSEYRGKTADSFWSWRDIMYRFIAKMTPEDAHVVARYLYLEMLKAGYTTVAEFHYLHHQVGGKQYENPAEMSHQVIQAAKSTGISITHLPVLYTYAGFGELAPSLAQGRFIHQQDKFFKLLEELNSVYKSEESVGLGVAPHSLRAVSKAQLDDLVPFVRNLNPKAPVHIHIAEQLKEVEDCLAHYGKRPVEWLIENYELDPNWCLIHATHLTENEVKQLANSGAVAGICPTTEANLGDGIFPTERYLAMGGKLAIGSDSHISVNVADELRILEYAQRLTTYQRAVLVSENSNSVGQTLYAKSAKDGALTVNQSVGEIAVGNRADFVVLDMNSPSLYCKKESFILDAAIFASNALPVKEVMVAGDWKVTAGQHSNEERLTRDYLAVMAKLSE